MGTNFYWLGPQEEACAHCGHQPEAESLHIGKSSYGWVFALRAHPSRDLKNIAYWYAFLESEAGQEGRIVDEYYRPVTLAELRETIENRNGPNGVLRAVYAGATVGVHPRTVKPSAGWGVNFTYNIYYSDFS